MPKIETLRSHTTRPLDRWRRWVLLCLPLALPADGLIRRHDRDDGHTADLRSWRER